MRGIQFNMERPGVDILKRHPTRSERRMKLSRLAGLLKSRVESSSFRSALVASLFSHGKPRAATVRERV